MAGMKDQAASAGAGPGRSRRVLRGGAAGGLGVLAAGAVARPAPAMADNGQPVLQGADNGTPTRRTAVLTKHESGVLADPNTSGRGSLGVFGAGQDFGVRGEGAEGLALASWAPAGDPVVPA